MMVAIDVVAVLATALGAAGNAASGQAWWAAFCGFVGGLWFGDLVRDVRACRSSRKEPGR